MSKKKLTQRLVSLALCAALLCSLFAACQKQEETSSAPDSSAESTPVPSAVEEGDFPRAFEEDGFFHVDYNTAGEYTVSFTQANLFATGKAAEEMSRDLSEEEASEESEVTEETLLIAENPEEDDGTGLLVAYPLDFASITQDDLKVSWTKVTWPEESQDEAAEPVEPTYEDRTAAITHFENTADSVTLTFSDPDAAAEHTSYYHIAVGEEAGVGVEVDFKDHTLTSSVKEISAAQDSVELTLSLSEGEFSPEIKPEDITLGYSFQEMTVAQATPNGGYLTLKLEGSPVLLPEIASVYTAGEITLAPTAFVNGAYAQSVYIEVQAPVAGVDLSQLEENGSSVTFPVEVLGVDASEITPEDVAFDGDGTVTDVKVEGDQILVTVQSPTESTEDISGDLTVGDASIVVSVTHAAVETVFDLIEQDGDDLLITLTMSTLNGTIAPGLAAEQFTLDMDFAGGKVEEINVLDDTTAKLVIRFPRGDMTEEDYAVLGVFDLAEGALVDENGSPAPVTTYARLYLAEEMGRDTVDTAVENGIKIAGNVFDEKVTKAMGDVYKYGRTLYDTVTSALSGKWGAAFSGAKKFLTLLGIIGGDEEPEHVEATNDEIMAEVKAVQDMLSVMDQKLDAATKQIYQNRLASFETDLGVLESDCTALEAKLNIAKEDLAKQNVTLAEDATDQQASEYMDQLINYCEEQEKAGNRDFKNFARTEEEMEAAFKRVAVESAKSDAASPFFAYDGYWDVYFNFHTQSYFLRSGYLAQTEYALKRAYNLLATYYNIPAHQESYANLTTLLSNAVKSIEARPLGDNPTLTTGNLEQVVTYSGSFNKTYSGSTLIVETDFVGRRYSDAQVNEFKRRVRTGSLKEELLSAGFTEFTAYSNDSHIKYYPYEGDPKNFVREDANGTWYTIGLFLGCENNGRANSMGGSKVKYYGTYLRWSDMEVVKELTYEPFKVQKSMYALRIKN